MNHRKKSVFVYLILVHLLLAVMLVKSDFISKVREKFSLASTDMPYFYQRTLQYHKDMDASIPAGAVLFIGDSITQALATSAISDYSVNFGIGSDTTYGVLQRLPFYQSMGRSKAVVLAIGINDVATKVGRTEILSNYKNILDGIPSNVSIIVSAMLPVGKDTTKVDATNEYISALNADIEMLTRGYLNVVYLDAGTALKNDSGYLDAAFHMGDGVHLSDKGYRVLIESLRDTLSNIP